MQWSAYFSDGYRHYNALRRFLLFSNTIIYCVCLSLYVCVICGPYNTQELSQVLIIFLLLLIVWPIVTTMSAQYCLSSVKSEMKAELMNKLDKIELSARCPNDLPAMRNILETKEYLLELELGRDNYSDKFSVVVTVITGIIQTIPIIF